MLSNETTAFWVEGHGARWARLWVKVWSLLGTRWCFCPTLSSHRGLRDKVGAPCCLAPCVFCPLSPPSFQLTVEMFDYMDCELKLSESGEPGHENTMGQSDTSLLFFLVLAWCPGLTQAGHVLPREHQLPPSAQVPGFPSLQERKKGLMAPQEHEQQLSGLGAPCVCPGHGGHCGHPGCAGVRCGGAL